MITYHVRSRALIDLVNEIKQKKLILAPFFQRKLVWREGHKVDFIETILLGYPFPEIFLSRGIVDLETMTSSSSIVDGQQRMTTIKEYIEGEFSASGRTFQQLTPSEKESFLKYEIATIELDLQHDDDRIVEIFKRLNRTFYALSTIEKMATEFAASEFMLVAKLLCNEFSEEGSELFNIEPARVESDPNLTEEFAAWANRQKLSAYRQFVLSSPVFSKYEISRSVHLMFTLNVMATMLHGIYGRNDLVKEDLEQEADAFEDKERLVRRVNDAAAYFNRLVPKTGTVASFWHTKSNSFTLLVTVDKLRERFRELDIKRVRQLMAEFAGSPPPEYEIAAKEGVNNKKERVIRQEHVERLMLKAIRVDEPTDAGGGDQGAATGEAS